MSLLLLDINSFTASMHFEYTLAVCTYSRLGPDGHSCAGKG